ncbi:hypothetical protein Leryth_004705 [Lithospermum erythrorhizon]|nr:hypothetical protein Leryth_004705 [Lithospermum erythrorhizon]
MSTEIMNNNKPLKMDLDETELRLGLPGGGGKEAEGVVVATVTNSPNANGKRGFEETVDLKLSLSSNKLMMEPLGGDSSQMMKNITKEECNPSSNIDQVKPPAKAQVVGWPPVRNFRKNIFTVQQKSNTIMEEGGGGGVGAALVKVSIDGAPYLRKVDLKMFKSYQELSDGLGKMFSSFTTGNYEAKGMIDFMNENNKLMDLLNSSDFVPTYEDKDGDWMLVGDVPWGMFVESCKRLRIMKGIDAAGLAPRAMAKCKNRS